MKKVDNKEHTNDEKKNKTAYLCYMDIQMILVCVLFLAAAFYLGRMLYSNLRPKKGNSCGANCKCGVDFSQVPPPAK